MSSITLAKVLHYQSVFYKHRNRFVFLEQKFMKGASGRSSWKSTLGTGCGDAWKQEVKRCGVAECLWVDKCLSCILEITVTRQHVQKEKSYLTNEKPDVRIGSRWRSRRTCSHSLLREQRALESQLTAEQSSTGRHWNSPKMIPHIQDKGEATVRQ